ncbi:MAG: nucleotidyltransferase family protein [Bacilli bacterium]
MRKSIEIINSVIKNDNKRYELLPKDYTFFKINSLSQLLWQVVDLALTSEKVRGQIKSDYYNAIAKETSFANALETVLTAFDNANIKCCVLKGSIIKNLYPYTFYRSMGDMDLYVDKKDVNKALKILKGLEYKKDVRSGKDIGLFHQPNVYIELHYKLISEYEYGANYYNDGVFNKCELYDESKYKNIYKFNINEYYIYMVMHLLKHYVNNLCGIRMFLDMEIYLNAYEKELDFTHINEAFKYTAYEDLCIYFKEFAKKVFSIDLVEEKDKEVGDLVFDSGVYGNVKYSERKNFALAKGNRFKYYLISFFPPVKTIKAMYYLPNVSFIFIPFCYMYLFINRFIHFGRSFKKLKRMKKTKKK